MSEFKALMAKLSSWESPGAAQVHSLKQAGDPLGRDRATTLPNPDAGIEQEDFPEPSPDLLRSRPLPNPINPVAVRADMDRVIRSTGPGVRRSVLSLWEAMAQDITVASLEPTRRGEVQPPWEPIWRERVTAWVGDDLEPAWLKSGIRGARAMKQPRPKRKQVDIFALLGPLFESWVATRSGELISDLVDNQLLAIRQVLNEFIVEKPTAPRRLARILRQHIGLTARQTRAVQRIRRTLEDDGLMTAAQIDSAVGRQVERMRNVRARRIAETETAFAYNYGGFTEVAAAAEEGAFEGERVIKIWRTAQDEKVCPFCAPLGGFVAETGEETGNAQRIGLEETFPGRGTRLTSIFVPPAHPHCRCLVLYEVV